MRGADRDLLNLILGQVCLHAAMTGARMAAPLLALSNGHGPGAAGVLVALFAVTQIFLSLPAGRYADRRGLKRPLALCAVAATLGIGAAAAWPVYPVLCVMALACGGAVGAAVLTLQRHLGRAADGPAQRMRLFSWLSVAAPTANFIGPMITGLAIDHLGFRWAFLFLAFLPPLAWWLARNAREAGTVVPASASSGGVRELLRDPLARRVFLLNALMSSSWDLHTFMVPVLGFDRGIDAAGIGFVLGMLALSAALVRFAMPAITMRVPEWRILTLGVGTTGILLLAYPWTNSLATMAICSALLGITLGSVQPNVLALLHDITPPHRHGEALAVRLISINVTALTMPLLLGASAGIVGVSGVFWAVGAIVTAGSRAGMGLRPEARKTHPH